MYTKEDLILHLQEMELKPTDAVMMHSSMKSIGDVEGGADTVLDALMEYFAPGLLMLPTHTWDQMNPDYNVFDPKTEPACVGTPIHAFFPVGDKNCAMQENGDSIRISVFCLIKTGNLGLNRV